MKQNPNGAFDLGWQLRECVVGASILVWTASLVLYLGSSLSLTYRHGVWWPRYACFGRDAPSWVAAYVYGAGIASPIAPVHLVVFVLPTLPIANMCFSRALRQGRARRRHLAGQCVSCGYNLRATVLRCPECGAEMSAGDSGGDKGQRG